MNNNKWDIGYRDDGNSNGNKFWMSITGFLTFLFILQFSSQSLCGYFKIGTFVLLIDEKSLTDLRRRKGRPPPPRIQLLSFSCNFRRKFSQTIDPTLEVPPPPPHLENPGSVTEKNCKTYGNPQILQS